MRGIMKNGENMRSGRRFRFLWMLLVVAAPVCGGEWVVPDWNGEDPQFPMGIYAYWKSKASPIVYRTEFEATPETACVALRVKSQGAVVIRVNGHLSCEYAIDLKKKGGPGPKDKANPRRKLYWFEVDDTAVNVVLIRGIRPGKNVLAVSGAPGGLALDGAVVERSGKMTRLATSKSWRVKKYPPCSFLRFEKDLNSVDVGDGWVGVKADPEQGISASDDAIKTMVASALQQRQRSARENLLWRLEMILKRGYVIDDWESFGFGGAGRLPDEVHKLARTLRQQIQAVQKGGDLYSIEDGINALSLAVRLGCEAESLANASPIIGKKNPQAGAMAAKAAGEFGKLAENAFVALRAGKYTAARQKLEGVRATINPVYRDIEKYWKNVVNRLNTADANRFGWFDVTHLLDNDINRWGLRVGEIAVSWKMNLNGRWRFKLDPQNIGLKETRHDPAYNIEGQWPEVTVPGDWEHQGFRDGNPGIKATNPFPGTNDDLKDGPYNGWAWYRKTLQLPAEWAGYDLELLIDRIDDYDWTYFNGQEIGQTTYKTNPKDFWKAQRRYHIPKEMVKFGGINVIAVRVFDCRDKGGIMGDVTLRCPGLREAFENRTAGKKSKPTLAYSSPLSIGSIMTSGQDPMMLWGWNERGIHGPGAIGLSLKNGVGLLPIAKTGVVFDPERDGEMKENWALLWPDASSEDRPVLAVFLDRPKLITAKVGEKGTSKIEFTYGKEGARVVFARPFRGKMKPADKLSAEVVERCRFWAKALLAYPVSFTEVNERVADYPWMLNVTNVYTYKILQDAWGTKPVKLAPLPPLLSYAAKTKFPGVDFPAGVSDLAYPLGKYGDLKAVLGADKVSYRVPLDKIPAFGGTTSFAFSPIDIGKGNVPEVEGVSLFGGNGWRPQTVKGAGEEIEHCINAGRKLGVNILVNGCLGFGGGPKKILAQFESLAKAYAKLPFDAISYDPYNEPAHVRATDYTPLVKDVVEVIRRHDKEHLIYIESPESFASVLMLEHIKPIDDPKVIYSFHDYDYRLYEFWPNDRINISNVYEGWFAALEFMMTRHARIHIGEWGGYEQRPQPWVWTRPQTITQAMDMCRIFQQFHIHFHYYANRGTTRFALDGSLDQSFLQEGFARFFARGHWNFYHKKAGQEK